MVGVVGGFGVSGLVIGLLLDPDSISTFIPLGSVTHPEPTPGAPHWLILPLPH